MFWSMWSIVALTSYYSLALKCNWRVDFHFRFRRSRRISLTMRRLVTLSYGTFWGTAVLISIASKFCRQGLRALLHFLLKSNVFTGSRVNNCNSFFRFWYKWTSIECNPLKFPNEGNLVQLRWCYIRLLNTIGFLARKCLYGHTSPSYLVRSFYGGWFLGHDCWNGRAILPSHEPPLIILLILSWL